MSKTIAASLLALLGQQDVAAGSQYKGKASPNAVYGFGSIAGLPVKPAPQTPQVPEPPADELYWSGGLPVPSIGDAVEITVNGIGPGTVVGYFTEYNWLGVEVMPVSPPTWFTRQNGPGKTALVYGVELKGAKFPDEYLDAIVKPTT